MLGGKHERARLDEQGSQPDKGPDFPDCSPREPSRDAQERPALPEFEGGVWTLRSDREPRTDREETVEVSRLPAWWDIERLRPLLFHPIFSDDV